MLIVLTLRDQLELEHRWKLLESLEMRSIIYAGLLITEEEHILYLLS